MSLRSKMDALEAKGRYVIWKRTSSPQGVRTVRKDIKSYLSEHTKPGVNQKAFKAGNHPNWLKEGVDYLTKEEQGKLKVFGFLRDDIFRATGKSPHQLDNDALIHASLAAWEERKSRKKIKRAAHKYVLSLNPELCEVLAQTGHGADELLTQSVRRVMRRYQEKYYPEGRLGYLVGIHHDKAHIHAHVMLFPTTESGKLLLVTDYSRKHKKYAHKRPYEDMRLFAEKEVARYYNREIKAPFRASERNPAKYVQPKLLALLAYRVSKKEMERANMSSEQRQQWAVSERDRILSGTDGELQNSLMQGYEASNELYEALTNSIREKKKAYKEIKQRVEVEKSQLADDLKQTFSQIEKLKEEAKSDYRTRRELYSDLSNWSHFRFNHGSVTEGGNNVRGREVSEWLQRKLMDSSELSDRIRNWVSERESREEEARLPKEMLKLMTSADDPIGAQRFTEKDRLVRRCLAQGAKKLGDPMMGMLNQNASQCEFLARQGQRDFVREFLKEAIRVRRDKQNDIKERREALNRRVKAIRLQQQSNKLKQDIICAVEKGRRPDFLEEYRHWKNLKIEIPTDALRPMRSGAMAKRRSESEGTLQGAHNISDRANGDYSTRLHQTLRNLRSIRMETGSVTLKGGMADYHQAGMDPPTRLHDTREKVVDQTLSRPAAEKFLKGYRVPKELSAEDHHAAAESRRKEVRARRMEQEDAGLLDR